MVHEMTFEMWFANLDKSLIDLVFESPYTLVTLRRVNRNLRDLIHVPDSLHPDKVGRDAAVAGKVDVCLEALAHGAAPERILKWGARSRQRAVVVAMIAHVTTTKNLFRWIAEGGDVVMMREMLQRSLTGLSEMWLNWTQLGEEDLYYIALSGHIELFNGDPRRIHGPHWSWMRFPITLPWDVTSLMFIINGFTDGCHHRRPDVVEFLRRILPTPDTPRLVEDHWRLNEDKLAQAVGRSGERWLVDIVMKWIRNPDQHWYDVAYGAAQGNHMELVKYAITNDSGIWKQNQRIWFSINCGASADAHIGMIEFDREHTGGPVWELLLTSRAPNAPALALDLLSRYPEQAGLVAGRISSKRFRDVDKLAISLGTAEQIRGAVISAAKRGDMELIRRVVDGGNGGPKLRRDILSGAVRGRSMEMVDFALSLGAIPVSATLREAVIANRPRMVRRLMNWGVKFYDESTTDEREDDEIDDHSDEASHCDALCYEPSDSDANTGTQLYTLLTNQPHIDRVGETIRDLEDQLVRAREELARLKVSVFPSTQSLFNVF